jgi:hypothetical protein
MGLGRWLYKSVIIKTKETELWKRSQVSAVSAKGRKDVVPGRGEAEEKVAVMLLESMAWLYETMNVDSTHRTKKMIFEERFSDAWKSVLQRWIDTISIELCFHPVVDERSRLSQGELLTS